MVRIVAVVALVLAVLAYCLGRAMSRLPGEAASPAQRSGPTLSAVGTFVLASAVLGALLAHRP